MLSTELPITEHWDPEWDIYEVPISCFSFHGEPEVPYAIWWACYYHLWEIEWITTGTAWYAPHNWQNQLEPPRRPPSWYPGQPDPPRARVDRCSCLYVRRYATMAIQGRDGRITRHRYVDRTVFLIDEQCTHHGIVALEHDEFDDAYPDGGVWGFTAEDC